MQERLYNYATEIKGKGSTMHEYKEGDQKLNGAVNILKE